MSVTNLLRKSGILAVCTTIVLASFGLTIKTENTSQLGIKLNIGEEAQAFVPAALLVLLGNSGKFAYQEYRTFTVEYNVMLKDLGWRECPSTHVVGRAFAAKHKLYYRFTTLSGKYAAFVRQ
jgi:hypothetical protein